MDVHQPADIQVAADHYSGTYVENLPWQDLAKRYYHAHTFFYVNPPY
jgi:site-specific DNA-adenine methylase